MLTWLFIYYMHYSIIALNALKCDLLLRFDCRFEIILHLCLENKFLWANQYLSCQISYVCLLGDRVPFGEGLIVRMLLY